MMGRMPDLGETSGGWPWVKKSTLGCAENVAVILSEKLTLNTLILGTKGWRSICRCPEYNVVWLSV